MDDSRLSSIIVNAIAALVVLAVGGCIGWLVALERSIGDVDRDCAVAAKHVEEHDRAAGEWKRRIVHSEESIEELRAELQRPRGQFKRFTSDDGDKLTAMVSAIEARLSVVERDSVRTIERCEQCAQRLDAVEESQGGAYRRVDQ